MNVEIYRNFCLQQQGVTESFPFDDKILVFKVCNKMFSLGPIEPFDRINLKCEPQKAIQLREQYPNSVLPGYHMCKKTWNTILINRELTDHQVFQLIIESYELILKKLPKKLKKDPSFT